MPRRATSRAQSTAAVSSPAPGRASNAHLPAYEAPTCHLDEEGVGALRALVDNRQSITYSSFIKESFSLLGTSVSDMHERYRIQKDRLDHLRRRREEKGIEEKTADEERLEEHLERLATQIDEYTREAEQSVRELIDDRVELEDEGRVLQFLFMAESTKRLSRPTTRNTRSGRRRGEEDSDEQDEDEGFQQEVISLRNMLKTARSDKKAQFTDMAAHQRYALDNDYAGFKKMWHDAAMGEDGPPLADPSRWFTESGEPVIRSVAVGEDEGLDEGSDDDIAVAREVISLHCPLTLRPLELPYSNRKCKHTFEKSALLDYLPPRGTRQCPQTGCSEVKTIEMPISALLITNDGYRLLRGPSSMRTFTWTRRSCAESNAPSKRTMPWTTQMRWTKQITV